ncbi:unnamed protein product [Amoebophrya sp. A25]|nr:unnamed protein product [Amoebophrya sp. A25]|eukprot:GSA25T00023171001.1
MPPKKKPASGGKNKPASKTAKKSKKSKTPARGSKSKASTPARGSKAKSSKAASSAAGKKKPNKNAAVSTGVSLDRRKLALPSAAIGQPSQSSVSPSSSMSSSTSSSTSSGGPPPAASSGKSLKRAKPSSSSTTNHASAPSKKIIKARTAYVFYCKATRDTLIRKYREKKGSDPSIELLSEELNKRYQLLSAAQRVVYENHEKMDDIRYRLQKREFSEGNLPSLLSRAIDDCGGLELSRDLIDAVRELDGQVSGECKAQCRAQSGIFKSSANRGTGASASSSSSSSSAFHLSVEGSLSDHHQHSWRRLLAQWTWPEDEHLNGGGASKAPRATGDYRLTMVEKLTAIFEEVVTAKMIATSIEKAMFQHHAGDMKQYAASGRSLLHNLRTNVSLRKEVQEKHIEASDLVKMSPRELATDDLKKEREEREAKALKDVIGTALPKNKWQMLYGGKEERGGVARIESQDLQLESQLESQAQSGVGSMNTSPMK